MGRRLGNKNTSTKRAETAARVRAYRERQAEKADAEKENRHRSEATLRRLRQNGFTLFGELETGPSGLPIDAQTAEEELMLAKEYAAALNLPDILPGQTIRNFVTEVLRAWCSAGARMFNRSTGQFSTNEFEGLKPDDYQFPIGVDEAPIKLETEEVTNA